MTQTPGICLQTRSCSAARKREIRTIELGAPFTCPECGGGLVAPLQAPSLPDRARLPPALVLALPGGTLLLVAGAMFLGHELVAVGAAPAVTTAPAPPALAQKAPDIAPAAIEPPVQVASTARQRPEPKQATTLTPPSPPPVLATSPATAKPAGMVQPAPAIVPPAPPLLAMAPVAAQPAGTVQPAPATPKPTAAVTSVVQMAPKPAASLPAQVPPSGEKASLVASAPPVAGLAATTKPALPDQAFSATPVAGAAPAYPTELAEDGRPGRVIATCTIQVDGTPTGCRVAGARGSPAFYSAFDSAALTWLTHGRVRFRPVIQHGRPAVVTQSWPVTIEETGIALAEARRKAQEARTALAAAQPGAGTSAVVARLPLGAARAPLARPAPLVPQQAMARQVLPQAAPLDDEHSFSTHVLSGGAPDYPQDYDDQRSGRVSVRCTIGSDGRPAGCGIVQEEGGSAFGSAVLHWLRSGRVRFAPILVGGHAVSEVRTWRIVFRP